MIAVRLDSRESLDQPPFGHVIDYLTYGGLYRAISLEVKEPSYIADAFIHGTAEGVAHLCITAVNPQGCTLSAQIVHNNKLIAQISEQNYVNQFRFDIPSPPLWDPLRPELCKLIIQLRKDGALIDTYETRFGFQVQFYNLHRSLFQFGSFYRLKSPFREE